MVQRRATPNARVAKPSEVHEAAERGVGDARAPLPYLAEIQAAFGKHDVTGVTTASGGAAEIAGDVIGANAYAYGDRVAFSRAPDLRTSTHEAAHVVQQRRGIGLADGIGSDGDTHERQADLVADPVVAGRSVEHLLDSDASGSTTKAVQRDSKKTDPRAGKDVKVELDPQEPFRVLPGGEIWFAWRGCKRTRAAM